MERRNYDSRSRSRKTQIWISIGAVVLIILLILWLTIADLWGDTDVNFVTPVFSRSLVEGLLV